MPKEGLVNGYFLFKRCSPSPKVNTMSPMSCQNDFVCCLGIGPGFVIRISGSDQPFVSDLVHVLYLICGYNRIDRVDIFHGILSHFCVKNYIFIRP